MSRGNPFSYAGEGYEPQRAGAGDTVGWTPTAGDLLEGVSSTNYSFTLVPWLCSSLGNDYITVCFKVPFPPVFRQTSIVLLQKRSVAGWEECGSCVGFNCTQVEVTDGM